MQPKFCEILSKAKEIALKEEHYQVIHALDSGIAPDGEGAEIYRTLVDRAFEMLNQKEVV